MTTLLPEWAPHERIWIGFPAIAEEWGSVFHSARQQIAAFASAMTDHGRGEHVTLVCNSAADAAAAHGLIEPAVEVIVEPLGDIWLRDTAPIITGTGNQRRAADFAFNGWGGKYVMPGDADLGERLAAHFGLPRVGHAMVLEGGAIDWDGAGRVVTTEQCLLNPNRNPGMSREAVEQVLADVLGLTDVLWLGDGLANDHTDGHVDNLARWVAPGVLLLPVASGEDDPNAAVYADAMARAQAHAGITVQTMPSPGRQVIDGQIVPASYMNFAVGNHVVVMPAYGSPHDAAAADVLAKCFPGRRIIALPSLAILSGGGSFHCASQQVPA